MPLRNVRTYCRFLLVDCERGDLKINVTGSPFCRCNFFAHLLSLGNPSRETCCTHLIAIFNALNSTRHGLRDDCTNFDFNHILILSLMKARRT